MKVWATIAKTLEAHDSCAMVSIVEVEGSAPREVGARLLVTPQGYHGTIGGGALEWQVYDKTGKPTAERGKMDGVPVWSLIAVFARPGGGFTIVY